MKLLVIPVFLISCWNTLYGQQIDTIQLYHPVSKYDTIIYERIIEFDFSDSLYHVRDYYPGGQLQMEGTYSSINSHIKGNYWCNYSTNTKQGLYRTWYRDGQIESRSNFVDGKFQGQMEEWYSNGQIIQSSHWIKGDVKGNGKGQMNGQYIGWTKDGEQLFDMTFDKGLNDNPVDTNYQYIEYVPPDYSEDTLKRWPLIIYLHGGSARGNDTIDLYNAGIPDQIWRGRHFPFVIVAPQCPSHLRWSTDNWFENFFEEVSTKFRIDTNRVYLTGVSLGGAGTWYLAIKYPNLFAAIAPISGFTSHIEFIDQNVENLVDLPIWAFHGRTDKFVQFEETERVIRRLEGKNKNLKFTLEPDVGHWMHWQVYPEAELYDWFLIHNKSIKNTK